MRVLIVDNYDSFTYNLVQYLGELGAELDVVRNDVRASCWSAQPDRVIVSPGPCTPAEAGLSVEAIRHFAEAGTPVLGVCLGHQALAAAFGGTVVRGEPVHGKTAEVEHDGRTIFAGLESPLVAGRYHSLIVDPGAARLARGLGAHGRRDHGPAPHRAARRGRAVPPRVGADRRRQGAAAQLPRCLSRRSPPRSTASPPART